MKTKIVALIIGIICAVSFVGCGNKDMFDTVYTYDRVVICLPDGTTVSGEIKNWTDYEDGDQLQVTMKDGTVYLTHAINCTLIKDAK